MNAKREKRVRTVLSIITLSAIILLTVPTILVIFYNISSTLFKVLNTIGLLMATIRIIISLTISVTTIAVKGESTYFKKSAEKEAKLLFIATIIIQFINFMFINFE